MDSLKRLGSNSHLVESLPAPSSLLSSSGILMSSQLHHQPPPEPNHENQHHIDMLNISSATSNDNDIRSGSVVTSISEKGNADNEKIVLESIQSQQHQTQFIYHALSSTNNRHRRSLTGDIESSNFKRHLMKRFIVKRNFPNNQLSKSSDEMNEDESNEIELDVIDDVESDDYVKGEDEEEEGDGQKNKDGQHDRLDDDNNESDLVKSKMDVPYWDAYDTVNQLFLEMSEYYLHFIYSYTSILL